jgi:hypothetical protein
MLFISGFFFNVQPFKEKYEERKTVNIHPGVTFV